VFSACGTSTAINWKVGLQKVMTLSTTAAKYIAMMEAVKEAL